MKNYGIKKLCGAIAGYILRTGFAAAFIAAFFTVGCTDGGSGDFSVTEEQTEAVSETSVEEKAREILDLMTTEEKINQLFFVTPESLTGEKDVTCADEAFGNALSVHPVGGIIFFSSNITGKEQLREMLGNADGYGREVCPVPLFLGVDEEGGTVARLSGNESLDIPAIPDMKIIGERGRADDAYEAGETIGSYLHEYGFNVDFAPVADVITEPENVVVRDRSFGSDPYVVSEMAVRLSEGLEDKGIISCFKHFPGHGATKDDSHEGFAFAHRTLEELEQRELIPFENAVKSGADFIMVGHISLPEITGDNTPASVSPTIIRDILRNRIGYDGIVITDSLSMKALTEFCGSEEAALKAFEAGADMLLMPKDLDTAYDSILSAFERGDITEERLDSSVLRIIKLKLEKGI